MYYTSFTCTKISDVIPGLMIKPKSVLIHTMGCGKCRLTLVNGDWDAATTLDLHGQMKLNIGPPLDVVVTVQGKSWACTLIAPV